MNMHIFSSLRARLMLLVLLGAIPLLILLIYSGIKQRDQAAVNVQHEAVDLVKSMTNEHLRLVKDTHQLLSVLAHVPLIQNEVNIDSCNNFLSKLLREINVYVNVGVIYPNGDVLCSGVPGKGKVNVSDRSYFQRTLKTHDFSIGDYQIGRITKTAVLVFSYPVFDKNKQLKSVLFAALPLNWIKNKVSKTQFLQGSVVTVIDHSTHTLLAQYPESTVQVGTSVEKSALVKAIHVLGGTGTATINKLDGIKRLHVFRRLHGLPDEKDIYISLSIPRAAIYARANTALAWNLAVLIIVVVLVLLFAWYGIYAMVFKQVSRLLAVTRQVASGNYNARIEVSDNKNEISALGREFNKMTIALEQRESEVIRTKLLLDKKENNLRRLIETVPDIIYKATSNNNFGATYVSPALTWILGYTPAEFVTDPGQWAACIHDDDREQVIKLLQFALDNAEDHIRMEYRMWHKNGKTFRWFEDRARIDRDATNQTVTLYGIMTDITRQKQAESLSARIGHILEDSWNEIYIFDVKTLYFIDVSHGACENLGYSMEELKHLTPLDLKTALTSDQFEALIGPLSRGEKQQMTFEVDHQRKDDSCYPVEVRLQLSNAEIPPVFIAIVHDISERKRYIGELEHKALYDTLTELPNRSLFHDRLKHTLTIVRRNSLPLALFTIDVMRLREVNDIMGHAAGDLVLQEVASRLQIMLRESDTVARLGGDEFAVVMPAVDMEHASIAAGKIQKIFEQPVLIENTSLEIEAAIGVALYPEHGDEPAIILQHADIARHVAKNEATGFSIYNPEDNPYSLRRLKLLGELRHAIAEKELVLYYQPQINIRTGCITSVEALARWPHPVEGMISPVDFIPMIEQSGLVRPFTLWVLEEVVVQLKRWFDAGTNLSVAVNLSTRNLLDTELPHQIEKLLKLHNISPSFLTLEVTESAVMSRPESAMKVLTILHEMGHRLSIDDFGTGYSSLAYLKKMPVSELKIDQIFVSGLNDNDDDAIIVRSTIDLAQNMGLEVVAEGIEDKETLDTLEILRCDIGQGYHMSRPLPIEDLEQWLISSPRGLRK